MKNFLWKETLIPPHRCLQPNFHAHEIGMPDVDAEIAFHPRDNGGGDEDRTPAFPVPFPTEVLGRFPNWFEPVRNRIRCGDLIAGSPGDRDLDEMLFRRQFSVPMHQLLQHGCRIVLRCVDHFGARLMPPSISALGAFRAPYCELSGRVADAKRSHRFRQRARTHQRAIPAPARRIRFRTAYAPAELERVILEWCHSGQKWVTPVQKHADGLLVPVVGTTEGIHNTPHVIEPFTVVPGQRFSGLPRPPEGRFGNDGSHDSVRA